MTASIIALKTPELVLRASARADRSRALQILERRGSVTFDLAAVDAMSAEYADELFGVLTQYFGLDWVLDHIRVVGAHDVMVRTIAEAIHHRALGSRTEDGSQARRSAEGAGQLHH